MYTRHSIFQSSLKFIIAIVLSFIAASIFAQTATEPVQPPAETAPVPTPEKLLYASSTERDNALLATALPDEIQWLETPNEKVLGLFKEGEQKKTKGNLLMLHAPELTQRWPASLNNLRRNLPIYGWSTMALSLPPKYSIEIPKIDELRKQAPAGVQPATQAEAAPAQPDAVSPADKPQLSRAQLIGGRVDAAIAQLAKGEKLSTILLVDNSGAVDTLAVIYKKIADTTTAKGVKDGPLQALILVNLQEQESLTIEQLKGIFSAPKLPVMDVFFSPDDAAQIELRRLHRAEAMRQKLENYQQLILPPEHFAAMNDKQSFWLEKVRGFMERKPEENNKQDNKAKTLNQ